MIKIGKYQSDKVFFTADTHFGHNNIITYCKRSFRDVDEMDETLMRNWNSVVSADSIVFHCGDFGLGKMQRLKEIRERLNGEIYLVMGNHEFRQTNTYFEMFAEVAMQMCIEVDCHRIYLNHYPFLCFSGSNRRDVWQLFGHVHSSGNDIAKLRNLFSNQLDVGVDNNNFCPLSFPQVESKIEKQFYKQNTHER